MMCTKVCTPAGPSSFGFRRATMFAGIRHRNFNPAIRASSCFASTSYLDQSPSRAAKKHQEVRPQARVLKSLRPCTPPTFNPTPNRVAYGESSRIKTSSFLLRRMNSTRRTFHQEKHRAEKNDSSHQQTQDDQKGE